MAKARKGLFAITMSFLLLLAGCWDMKNVEELTIPIAAGYEIVNAPDSGVKMMDVYTIYPVFYKNAPRKSVVDIMHSGYIGETRTLRLEHLGGKLNLGGIQIAVLGRSLAQEGINNALDIILRTAEIKGSILIALAEYDIKDIFNVEPDNYPNAGIYLKTLLDDAYKQSFVPRTDLHHIITAMDTPGWHPIIPMLKVNAKEIIINGYGIFKDDKLAHTISVTETRILNILSGIRNIGEWTYPITCNNIPGYATVKMRNTAKIKVSRSGGSFNINVTVKSEGVLDEFVPSVDYRTLNSALSTKESLLKNENIIREIEAGYEELIKKEAEALIDKAQNEFKMDIFNWVKYAQAKWRKEIDSIDWDDCFSKMDVNVNINANIIYIGEEV